MDDLSNLVAEHEGQQRGVARPARDGQGGESRSTAGAEHGGEEHLVHALVVALVEVEHGERAMTHDRAQHAVQGAHDHRLAVHEARVGVPVLVARVHHREACVPSPAGGVRDVLADQ